MLTRVLEPEVMDSPDDARDYDSMDHAEVNARFVDDLLAAGADTSEVLDVGTGPAQIPIELCRRVETARVIGIDMAESMLDVAIVNVELAGLRDQIMLDRVDAKDLPYEDDRFTCVMSNSIIHHIPEPAQVVHEAWRVLSPGGVILIRDLLRPETEEQLSALVDEYARGTNAHQRQLFSDSLRAALTLDEMRQLVAALPAPAESVTQTTDRHWTWLCRKN